MNRIVRLGQSLSRRALAAALLTAATLFATPLFAAFAPYSPAGSFTLPGAGGPLDVLPSGRIVTVVGSTVYRETAPGSRVFSALGTLPAADIGPFGAAFVSVSPLGTKVAVGNNGGASFSNYEVGIFELATLTGTWFDASHFDGEWISNRHVALTAGSFGSPAQVTALDTLSASPSAPNNAVFIDNIGGASAGITLDVLGNIYTGNGFTTSGPSGTGAVRAFSAAAWISALVSGTPLNFETQGVLVIDILSASPLGFDHAGNLLIGGGEFGGPDSNFAAVARGADVLKALLGGGPVDPSNPNKVQKLDPDSSNPENFYTVEPNPIRHELYLTELGNPTVWVFD